jgi:Zn-dependent protease
MNSSIFLRPSRGLFIGRILGIELYLDPSWFIMLALLILSLISSFARGSDAAHSELVTWAMGIGGALFFFLSILLHELGHSVVSQRCGIPVPRITLLFVGGVAEISREPDTPQAELKIALGGPAVSVGLIGLYTGVWVLFGRCGWDAAADVALWLAMANAALVLFNMIPGYPLDGGRLLRAVLWAHSGNLRRATYVSSRIGIGLSWLLIAWGLYALTYLQQWGALPLFFVAMFLKSAAQSGYSNVLEREMLGGLSARDLMTAPPAALPDSLPLNLAADDYFLRTHQDTLPVCNAAGDFLGFLRLQSLLEIPRPRWPYTSVGDLDTGCFVQALEAAPDEPANRVSRRVLAAAPDPLAVVDDGKLVGMITPQDLQRAISVRMLLEN